MNINTEKKANKGDSWSKPVNTIVSLMVTTALIGIVFGFFFTFGAVFALKVL